MSVEPGTPHERKVRMIETPAGATRVLVVDDEPSITDLVSMALRYEQFDVRVASNGREALDAVESFSPDMAVLDIMMPGIDGFEVARRLRNQGARLPILFLTARDATGDKVRGLTLGGDDYMTKPFSVEELVAQETGPGRHPRKEQPVLQAVREVPGDQDGRVPLRVGGNAHRRHGRQAGFLEVPEDRVLALGDLDRLFLQGHQAPLGDKEPDQVPRRSNRKLPEPQPLRPPVREGQLPRQLKKLGGGLAQAETREPAAHPRSVPCAVRASDPMGKWRARRDSNPRPSGPQPDALSAELRAHAMPLRSGGEGGIRTLGAGYPTQRFSKPPHSASMRPLRPRRP